MKKKMLVLAFTLLGTTTFAQIRFAPEVGLSMFNQSQKTSIGNTVNSSASSMLPGFRAGAVVDIPLMDHFVVQPALYYTLNRTNINILDYGSLAKVEADRTFHALQLPIYFMYKSGQAGEGRFFGGVGPYFAYGVGGNDKVKSSIIGFTGVQNQTINFGDDAGDAMRPFDIGGSLTLGYELPMGLYFRGHYNLGFANLQPQGDSDNSLKNRSFGVSVGYFLN